MQSILTILILPLPKQLIPLSIDTTIFYLNIPSQKHVSNGTKCTFHSFYLHLFTSCINRSLFPCDVIGTEIRK